jgi:hypothetical protein
VTGGIRPQDNLTLVFLATGALVQGVGRDNNGIHPIASLQLQKIVFLVGCKVGLHFLNGAQQGHVGSRDLIDEQCGNVSKGRRNFIIIIIIFPQGCGIHHVRFWSSRIDARTIY